MNPQLAVSIPSPRKAEKKRVKLKMAIQGPSGSGKTWGALALAKNLWPEAKICLIDTENESASLYADRFEFDTIPLTPPFHTDRYSACIDAVIAGGYDVLIIDSISHQWDGEGGILRRKEELDQRPGANSYTNWSKFTPEHSAFKEKIVQAPIHIIATMRSKQDYILETNEKGKSQPRKVGMAPIQRDGFDYEFSLVFDVQMDHKATVDKNRTGLFDGEVVVLSDAKLSKRLQEWLGSGKEVAAQPPANVTPISAALTASEPNRAFRVDGDRVFFTLLNVEPKKTKKGEEFLAVKMNGQINGKYSASCFHRSLFEAVQSAKNQPAWFEYEVVNDYVTITNVLQVGKQEYRDGKPYSGDLLAETEITDDDIPF